MTEKIRRKQEGRPVHAQLISTTSILERTRQYKLTKVARQFFIGQGRPLGVFGKENRVGAREHAITDRERAASLCAVYLPEGTVGCKLKRSEKSSCQLSVPIQRETNGEKREGE